MIPAILAAATFAWAAQADPSGSVNGNVTVNQKLTAKGVKILESIVYLEPQPKQPSKPVPSQSPAVIDQKSLTFVPRVTAIQAGGSITFRNSDKELHNVLARCFANRDFNKAVLPGGDLSVTFENEETVVLGCNIHPDMRAYILVLGTPYFAPLKEDGSYAIANVPPGKYKVKVWNERFPTAVKEITVEAGQEARADFDFDSSKKVPYAERDAAPGGGQ